MIRTLSKFRNKKPPISFIIDTKRKQEKLTLLKLEKENKKYKKRLAKEKDQYNQFSRQYYKLLGYYNNQKPVIEALEKVKYDLEVKISTYSSKLACQKDIIYNLLDEIEILDKEKGETLKLKSGYYVKCVSLKGIEIAKRF